MRLLAYFCEESVPADSMTDCNLALFGSVFGAFIANKTEFIRMHEVVAMSEVDFFILEFHPHHFFHQFVAPALHYFKRGIELTVEDPEEDEALIREEM